MSDKSSNEVTERAVFEKWLLDVHGLSDTFDAKRGCYKEFAAHLAFCAWKAARHVETFGWRSINTAPPGGEWILLAWPAVTSAPFVGYRVYGRWHAATGGDTWSDSEPTHWQPLPAMPSEKAFGERCKHGNAHGHCQHCLDAL